MENSGPNVFFDVIVARHSRNEDLLPEIRRLIKLYPGDEINKPNTRDAFQRWTSLHFAAYLKNGDLVKVLCTHPNIQLMARDEDSDTPLHVASYWDHTEIITILLKEAKARGILSEMLNAQNCKLDTPFSYASSRFHTDTCKIMLDLIPPLTIGLEYKDDDEGRRSREFAKLPRPEHVDIFLKNNKQLLDYHQRTKHESSVINILIANIPGLVTEILDKSIMETKIASLDEEGEKRTHKNTYRMLVDFGCLECHDQEDTSPKDVDRYEQTGTVYRPGSCPEGETPLQMMVKKQRSDLLKHPVVDALVSKKWARFARNFFYAITFLSYVLFFSMLLTYELSQIRPFLPDSGDSVVVTRVANTTHPCGEGEENSCYSRKTVTCFVSGYFVLVMSSVRLFLELLDFLNEVLMKGVFAEARGSKSGFSLFTKRFMGYMKGLQTYCFSYNNILEIFLYSLSLVFSLNILTTGVMSTTEWQIGSFAVFLSFLNLLSLLQVVPGVGLYIIMFLRILRNFITKIAALLVFFIFLFVVIFHMLLSERGMFSKFLSGESVYRTVSKGVSGIEGDDYSTNLSYPQASLVGLIIFAIFVQVLFLNLATGLAIEDVKEIRDEAEAEMTAIKISHIYHAEKILFTFESVIGCKILPTQKRFQNMPTKIFKLDKIQYVRERREKIDEKLAQEETAEPKAKVGLSQELEDEELADLRNEVRNELGTVSDLIKEFSTANTSMEKRLCKNVTFLKNQIVKVSSDHDRRSGEVETKMNSLDSLIDDLSKQNVCLRMVINEIAMKCDQPRCIDCIPTLSKPNYGYGKLDQPSTSVNPSAELRELSNLLSAKIPTHGRVMNSRIERLKKELISEIKVLRDELRGVSEKNARLGDRVVDNISDVRDYVQQFAETVEESNEKSKGHVTRMSDKMEQLIEDSEGLEKEAVFIRDNFPAQTGSSE